MVLLKKVFAPLLTGLVVSLVGCTSETATSGTGSQTSAPSPTVDTQAGHDHASHAHAAEGPHHGTLSELGNDEYHAEFLHDDQSVTIYILDGSADKQLPIDATEIAINTIHAGLPKQFKLDASPDENDPPGKSSRFVSSDQELASHINEVGAEPRLVLTINEKSYRGKIALDASHDHDH